MSGQYPNSTEQLYDFDARMSSKISLMDNVMSPLFEKDPSLELALQDLAHPTLTDAISTLSEASDFPLVLPSSVMNGRGFDGNVKEYPLPELSHPASLDVYESYSQNQGVRLGSQAVGENLLRHNVAATNPLSGDYTTDSFSLMSNPEHDLNGFLSQALPLTQMTTAVADSNAHAPFQTLSNMPCILPISPTIQPHSSPPLNTQPNHFAESFRQIYSTSNGNDMGDPMVTVVQPIISKEAAFENELASVSLAATRKSPTATAHTPASRRSAASVTEIGLISNKRNATPRLYECPICHKNFERAYNRKMHITTHEAIENRLKPFICPLESCGKRFARKHDKNRHYMGVHLRARKTSSKNVTPLDATASKESHCPAIEPVNLELNNGKSLLVNNQTTAWSS